MRRLTISLIFVLALASGLHAQIHFRVDLDGANEVPPVAAGSGGYAIVTLNPSNSISYEVHTFGLTGTVAHIHDGAAGVNGPAIAPLTGGPTVWIGTTPPQPAGIIDDLFAEGLYINVHTMPNLTGELRGQVKAAPSRFAALINASQVVAPTGSAATGVASVEVDAARMLTYTVTSPGLVDGTEAHLHFGRVGINGGIAATLSGGPNTWSGVAGPLTTSEYRALQTEAMYVDLHSTTFPSGEIRGQLIPTGVPYHTVPTLTPVNLAVSGPPTDGGTSEIAISNGAPFTQTFVLLSLGDGLSSFGFQPFLIDPGSIVLTNVVVPLDAAGERTITATIPALPSSAPVYLQAFNLDPSGPNGKFTVSNGVEVLLSMLP